jgi:hypothetical protein
LFNRDQNDNEGDEVEREQNRDGSEILRSEHPAPGDLIDVGGDAGHERAGHDSDRPVVQQPPSTLVIRRYFH